MNIFNLRSTWFSEDLIYFNKFKNLLIWFIPQRLDWVINSWIINKFIWRAWSFTKNKSITRFFIEFRFYICLFLLLSNTTLLSSGVLSSFILFFWCLISSFSDNFSDEEDKDCFLLIWLYFLFLAIEIIYRHILYQFVIYILLYNLVLKIC